MVNDIRKVGRNSEERSLWKQKGRYKNELKKPERKSEIRDKSN